MVAVKNARLVFNEVPTGAPIPGRTTIYDEVEMIDLDGVPLDSGFLVKTLAISIDPFLRALMRSSDAPGLGAAFTVGDPCFGFGIGKVIRSESTTYQVGQHLYGVMPMQEYFVASKTQRLRVLENKEKLPWLAFLGVLGMAGQTAYYGWKEYASAKQGETIYVSAAAGAVGSFVVQLAKAEGLKVIASAGTEEKLDFVRSLGADVVFNYKTTDTSQILQREGPIDVYWDHVGGRTLDTALQYTAPKARIIACGMISTYNSTQPMPIQNLNHVVPKMLKIYGFLVHDPELVAKYEEEFYSSVPEMVATGQLKYAEDKSNGLQSAGQAVADVLSGNVKGKSVVNIADD